MFSGNGTTISNGSKYCVCGYTA